MRPKIEEKNRKTKVVSMRIKEDTYESLLRQTKVNNIGMSEYMRFMVIENLVKTPEYLKEQSKVLDSL